MVMFDLCHGLFGFFFLMRLVGKILGAENDGQCWVIELGTKADGQNEVKSMLDV